MDEQIKEAFFRVKQDVFSLGNEISNLKLLIADMKNELKIITQALNDIREKELLAEKPQTKTKIIQEITPTHIPTLASKTPTIQQITPTHQEIPTDKLLSQVLKRQDLGISIGNQGVPTDKQTNRQTNRQTNT